MSYSTLLVYWTMLRLNCSLKFLGILFWPGTPPPPLSKQRAEREFITLIPSDNLHNQFMHKFVFPWVTLAVWSSKENFWQFSLSGIPSACRFYSQADGFHGILVHNERKQKKRYSVGPTLDLLHILEIVFLMMEDCMQIICFILDCSFQSKKKMWEFFFFSLGRTATF